MFLAALHHLNCLNALHRPLQILRSKKQRNNLYDAIRPGAPVQLAWHFKRCASSWPCPQDGASRSISLH